MSHQPVDNGNQTSEKDSHYYDVNFFKPKTAHSRTNRNMIIIMVLIWAVAVFGFQFALIIFNKPTPEASYTTFETLWPKIQDGSASAGDQQEFARVTLSVLGKNIAIKPDDKEILQDVLTQTVTGLLAVDQKSVFQANIADDAKKQEAVASAIQAIGLKDSGFDKLRADLLPSSLIAKTSGQISKEIPEIMKLYLIHNQSFLTDTQFMGFPFHYWYTAQFLLILFVVICLIYASFTDKMNTKYDFADE